jgi:hypothetical protein
MFTGALPFDETNFADLRTWSRQAERGHLDLQTSHAIPHGARQLMRGLLTRVNRRLTAKLAIEHPWLSEIRGELFPDAEHLMIANLQTDPEDRGGL